MDKNIIAEVKKKREFAGLPDSIVEKALMGNKFDVKRSRAFLRKYFGVFLTNRVLKGVDENVLKYHISSKKRDYAILYKKVLEIMGEVKSVIDFGCGVNAFSYGNLIEEFGNIKYVGVEASEQLCNSSNLFLNKKKFANAEVFCGDLLDQKNVKRAMSGTGSPRAIFILQTIDALESIEPNSSKKFLLDIKRQLNSVDFILVSNPLRSISGREKFGAPRRWLDDFLRENFKIIDSFELFDEQYIIIKG